MKNKKILFVPLVACFLFSSCDTIKHSIHGRDEFIDMGGGKYEVTVSTESSGLKAGRAEIYDRWDKTAIKACGGKKYRVIKKDWLSPNCLSGEIKCMGK